MTKDNKKSSNRSKFGERVRGRKTRGAKTDYVVKKVEFR